MRRDSVVRTAGRKATIQDIALDTGLSVSTVSRALAGTRKVSDDRVKIVEESAARLRYRLNKTARALRTSTTGTVGMVVPNIVNPFFPAIVESVETALAEAELSLVLCTAQGSHEIEARRIEILLEQNVDGLLITPVDFHESARAVRHAAEVVHVIQVDRATDVSTDRVLVDQGAGMTALLEHLVSQGCESFAYVGAEETSSTAERRHRAYVAGISKLGLEGADRALHGTFSVEWGEEAAKSLLEKRTGMPDAVVCANDFIAVGLIRALRRSGLRVPEEVLVSGFDDSTVGRIVDIPLTTVRQPLDQLGAEAVRMLLQAGANKDRVARSLSLEPTLIIRKSTGGND
jgi:LacI family transcriptional regulator